MNYKAIGLSLLLIAMPLLAEKFHLDPTQIVPAARGMVDVGRDSNRNTTLNLHVEHLARPGDLSPAKMTYVVWAEAPDQPPQNLGQLNVNNDLKADLKTTTALHNFQLVVTAEDNARATAPTGPVVLSANIRQP